MNMSTFLVVLIMFSMWQRVEVRACMRHDKNMLKTIQTLNIFKCVISLFQNVVFSNRFKRVLGMRRGSVNLDTLHSNALASKCRTYSTKGSGGTRLP